MAMERFGIYTASFVHAGGTLNLQQLDGQGIQTGSGIKTIRPGGALLPGAHILSTANPRVSFSTSDLYSVLNAMAGVFHLNCTGGHSMRFQRRSSGATFSGAADHYFQTSAKGFLTVGSIDVDVDSVAGATMALDYLPLSSAGENPITQSVVGNLGVVAAPAFTSQYYLGGLYVNAVQVESVVRARIVPGDQVVARRADGGVFPRIGGTSINSRMPVLELTLLNAGDSRNVTSLFANAIGAAVAVYLQRGTAATDGRIAAATASHLKFAITDGSWTSDGVSVAGEDDATTTIRILPTSAITPTVGIALGA